MTRDQRQKIKKRYGMTQDDYESMLRDQDGACAICTNVQDERTQKQRLFMIDHCHTHGHVRGLLCISCNTRLGGLEDASWFQRAQDYLNRRGKQ